MIPTELLSASNLLAVTCFILFLIQLYYITAIYWQLHRACRKNRRKETHDLPPLSVIIVAKDSAMALQKNLPAILEQDYPMFEVIVVYDKATGNDEDILKLLGNRYRHLYYSFIPETARYVSRKKLGIAMGIKASKYDWIVVTEPQCRPASDQWLKSMAAHFTPEAEIVLGYSNYTKTNGFFARRITLDRMFQAMRFLGKALGGHPYMGIGCNLAYRKRVYERQKGFAAQLNLQRGEDDLFINAVATPYNTRVAVNPESFMRMPVPKYKRLWYAEKINTLVTGRYYRGTARSMNATETITCALFHLTVPAGIIAGILQQEWTAVGIIGGSWLIRFVLFMTTLRLTAKDLEETFCFSLPVFDLLRPLDSLQLKIRYWMRHKADFLRR